MEIKKNRIVATPRSKYHKYLFGGSSGSSSGGSISIDTNNFVKKTGETSQTVEGDFVATGSIVAKYMAESYVPDFPIAGNSVLGLIKVGANLSIDPDGVLSATGGGSGVSSWNDLTDKPNTLAGYGILATDTLFDSKYAGSSHTHNYLSLTGGTLTGSLTATAFIKSGGTSSQFLKADGTVDSNAYLTGISSFVQNNLTYSTSNTTQALSAYQGYLLNRNDITAASLTASTLTLTRASGNITATVPTWNQNTTGSAAKLTTARTIWGNSFDGSGNVEGILNITGTTTNSAVFGGSIQGAINIQKNGTLGVGIYSAEAGTLGIYDNNAGLNRLFLHSSGNISINSTTDAGYKLDVNGTTRIFGGLHLNSEGWLNLYNSANTSRISISHNSASSKLDIYNRTTSAYASVEAGFITVDTITIKSNQSEKFIRSNAFGGAIRLRADSGTAGDRGLQLGKVDNNLAFTSSLAINGDSGNISIGTTTDVGQKLYVNGNAVASGSVVAKYQSSSYTTDWPLMSNSLAGIAIAGQSLILTDNKIDVGNRHYTNTSTYTDGKARSITAEISIGTGTMVNTESISITLSFLPVTISYGVVATLIANASNWTGVGMKVSLVKGATYWIAFVTNDLGVTVSKDGIYLSISAKQTV